MKIENVFKIAADYSSVRAFLENGGWDYKGKEEEMELFRNKESGKLLYVEDISEDFPVTFLMGEISLREFGSIAQDLTRGIKLLEVDSSWEGKPTTIVVAMTEAQVRDMFGRRVKMRPLPVRDAVSRRTR